MYRLDVWMMQPLNKPIHDNHVWTWFVDGFITAMNVVDMVHEKTIRFSIEKVTESCEL